MKRAMWVTLLLMLLIAALALASGYGGPLSFDVKPNKTFKQPTPKINFSAKQIANLKAKKPVCLLLPSPSDPELKAGYMAAIVPYDPVTVWQVITDIKHFHLTDPSYPNTGALTDRRRTFMPYVRDGAVCSQGGSSYLYQLLVMPFVAPRKYSLKRYGDRNGFPWESAWTAASELVCADRRNQEFDEYFNEAVQITHNNGCWHIQPVPEAWRTKPEDALNTYIEYYVDTNPGGNIGQIKSIVNRATSTALPSLHENLVFHSGHWEQHLKKHHSAAELAQWKKERAEFRAAMGF